MELRSEEEQEKENKGRKVIIITIILLIALSVILGVTILILKQAENQKTKLSIDGRLTSIPSNFILVDENNERYYAIKTVANLVGYKFYNGEYKKYTEDKTKCYVECDNELAMFELGSDIIYKSNSSKKVNFSEYKIGHTVKNYENTLYISADGIQRAFNTLVSYNDANSTIFFETLPYLANYYKDAVQNYGLTLSEGFANQKTIMNNMLVVSKDNKYGVVAVGNLSTVIGNKYDQMTYVENTNEFIVTNDGKTGTLSVDGQTKIGLRYDEVGLVDGKTKIYFVRNGGVYGVVNQNGKVLVYTEYEGIGVDRTLFPIADVKNDLFLYENCIPLKKDGKWGLADKNGEIIVNIEYDKLGYVDKANIPVVEEQVYLYNTPTPTATPTEKSINNVVVIPEIEGIVMGKNDKYGVVNSIGKMIIPCEYDKIYSITNEGKDEVYLEKDGKTTKLSKYLEENKIEVKGKTNTTTNTTVVNDTTNQTTNNNTTTNNTTNVVVNTNRSVNNTTNSDNSMRIIM